jgi:hypothetical protein
MAFMQGWERTFTFGGVAIDLVSDVSTTLNRPTQEVVVRKGDIVGSAIGKRRRGINTTIYWNSADPGCVKLLDSFNTGTAYAVSETDEDTWQGVCVSLDKTNPVENFSTAAVVVVPDARSVLTAQV